MRHELDANERDSSSRRSRAATDVLSRSRQCAKQQCCRGRFPPIAHEYQQLSFTLRSTERTANEKKTTASHLRKDYARLHSSNTQDSRHTALSFLRLISMLALVFSSECPEHPIPTFQWCTVNSSGVRWKTLETRIHSSPRFTFATRAQLLIRSVNKTTRQRGPAKVANMIAFLPHRERRHTGK